MGVLEFVQECFTATSVVGTGAVNVESVMAPAECALHEVDKVRRHKLKVHLNPSSAADPLGAVRRVWVQLCRGIKVATWVWLSRHPQLSD